MCKKRGGEEEKMIVVAHYTPTGLHRILYRIDLKSSYYRD
jgi:hypothetical protein